MPEAKGQIGPKDKRRYPVQTLTKDCKVGIYDNCEYVACIYANHIVITSPYVRWIGNTGSYDERTNRITDPRVLASVHNALADEAEDSAWGAIGRALEDQYLASCAQ